MTDIERQPQCFVISPIGDEDSDTRKRSDQVLKHIIRPAAEACGYKAERADEIDKPGLITSQVITRVVQDELVIADLTEMNPNVFYELALRHAVRKPLVQIIQKGERIPFDVAGTRTIHVDHTDLDSADNARLAIEKQIKALESDPEDMETPISVSLELQHLKQSDNPEDRNLADVISEITEIRQLIGKLSENRDALGKTDIYQMFSEIRENFDKPTLFSPARTKYFERNIYESMSFLRFQSTNDKSERAIVYAVLGSFFKEIAPWIYESAMDVFRAIMSGSESKAANAEKQFRIIVRTTVESHMIRDLIENDKRLFMAYRMLKEFAYELGEE